MWKQKYDREKIKLEFMLSEFDEVAPFIQQKFNKDTAKNKQVADMTKGRWKEKQAYKRKIYEKALEEKWKERANEIKDSIPRREAINENILQRSEEQFNEEQRAPKKWEKKRKMNTNDIMNIWKISRTERWLPTNISKVDQTNRDVPIPELDDDQKEAYNELLEE